MLQIKFWLPHCCDMCMERRSIFFFEVHIHLSNDAEAIVTLKKQYNSSVYVLTPNTPYNTYLYVTIQQRICTAQYLLFLWWQTKYQWITDETIYRFHFSTPAPLQPLGCLSKTIPGFLPDRACVGDRHRLSVADTVRTQPRWNCRSSEHSRPSGSPETVPSSQTDHWCSWRADEGSCGGGH